MIHLKTRLVYLVVISRKTFCSIILRIGKNDGSNLKSERQKLSGVQKYILFITLFDVY